MSANIHGKKNTCRTILTLLTNNIIRLMVIAAIDNKKLIVYRNQEISYVVD